MIDFTGFTLDNGLKILVNEDRSSPIVAMNLLYRAGSKYERHNLTGLAHLFEHLMFGGTPEVPDYDRELQLAGGENNAFTNSDITDYYLTVPAVNIETGFMLESDRMRELDFSQKNLDIQRKVVSEEFRQRYLNQPYGDAMFILRKMAYKVHPYGWPTIGRELSHIEKIGLKDIKDFFYTHYSPNNAILSLSGNISPEKAIRLSEKWFGPIPRRKKPAEINDYEPVQRKERRKTVEKKVTSDALYMAWHTGPRMSEDFRNLDLITDLLAGGESGRLYTKLVKKKRLFSSINAWITGETDRGLIILQGRLMKGVSLEAAEASVNEVIGELLTGHIGRTELQKVKNKYETAYLLSNTSLMNRAMNLALYEYLGSAELINRELKEYLAIDKSEVINTAGKHFTEDRCSILWYKASV
jgi:predicted Zn-dependent peptidase